MPELYFKVSVQGGKAAISELNTLDGTYNKVGQTSKKTFDESAKAAKVFGEGLGEIKNIAIGMAATFGGIGLIGQLEHWTEKLVEFETEFAKVTTLFESAPETFSNLKKELLDLGGEFGSNTELAKGLFATIQAGIPQGEAIGFLKNALLLSKTAFTDVGSAVELLKVSMTAYGKTQSETAETANTLFKILRQGGGMDASELSKGLGRLANTAAGLNVPLEDLGAILATLKQYQIPVTQGAVVLTTIMTKMTQEGSKLNKSLQDLHINISANEIKTKGFGEVLGKLAGAIKGDSELMMELGLQGRQQNAFMALAGTGAELYRKKLEELRTQGDEMAKAHERMEQTVGEAWEKLINDVERAVARTSAGTGVIMKVIQSLDEAVTKGTGPARELLYLVEGFVAVKVVQWLAAFAAGLWNMVPAAIALGRAFLWVAATAEAIKVITLYMELREVNKQVEENTKSLHTQNEVLAARIWKLDENNTAVKQGGRTDMEWAAALNKAAKELFNNNAELIAHRKLLADKAAADAKAKAAADAAAAAEANRKKITEEEKKEVEELTKRMFELAHPAEEIAKQIALLQRMGKWNATDFVRAFSAQIVQAAAATNEFGQVLPKSVAALLPASQQFETAKQKAKDFAEQAKKLADLITNEMPKAIASLQNKELMPNAENLVFYVATMAQLSGKVKTDAEAWAYALKYLEDYDKMISKNKENLRQQIQAYNDLHSPLALLMKDYELLGVSLNKNMAEMEKAWNRRKDLLTDKGYTDALENMTRAAIDQMQTLPAAVLKDLDKVIFGTNAAMREKLLPIWMEYQRSLKDINGQFAPETVDALMKVYEGTDVVLMQKMLPLWEEYLAAVMLKYGKLPDDLKKVNDKVTKQLDTATGKTREIWKNQVSTIVTDWSKGVADIIFEGKSMTETINGIFKEFGKMVVRTLMEALFSPVKKMLADLVDSIFDWLGSLGKKATKTATDTGSSIAESVIGGFTSALGGGKTAAAASTTGATAGAVAGATGFKFSMGLTPDQLKWLNPVPKAPAAGTYGNILTPEGVAATQAAGTSAGSTAGGIATAAAQSGGAAAGGAASTGGIFGLPKGGINNKGVGGPLGGIMTTAGMMLALDSLRRKGVGGYIEGGLGGALAGFAQYGLQGAAIGGGGMLALKGIMGKGAGSWASAIGGGALMGFGIAGPIGAAFGAAAAAIAKGIKSLIGAIMGKNSYQAGSMEVARDYGGVSMSEADYKKMLDQFGISEPTAYPIRKEISSSPVMLKQIGDLAKQQGKYQEFLKSLEATNKGNLFGHGFRAEYELGELTGDWEALDKAFSHAIETDTEFQKRVPNWREVMLLSGDAIKQTASDFEGMFKEWQKTGEMSDDFQQFMTDNAEALSKAAEQSSLFKEQLEGARKAMELWKGIKPIYEGFKGLKESLKAIEPGFETIYEKFLKTGEITDELKKQIEEYGGDLAKFQEVARLGQLNNYFNEMCNTFRETGEILPDLRQMFSDFGGDLKALDEAAKLPALKQSIQDIDDFAMGLGEILPELTPLQKVLQGMWDKDTWKQLEDLGFDPSKFVKIADLIKYEKGWETAVDDFYNKTEKVWDPIKQKFTEKWAGLQKGGLIEQGLIKYGGAEGQLAVERYQKEGINTISPAMLEKVKAGIDAEFQTERGSVLDYMKEMKTSTQEEIDTITQSVEDQFTIVGTQLFNQFDKARTDIVDVLDKILDKITESVNIQAGLAPATTTTPVTTTPPETTPTVGTGAGPGGYDGGGSFDPNWIYNNPDLMNLAQMNPYAFQQMMNNPDMMRQWMEQNGYPYAPIPGAQIGGMITKAGLIMAHDQEMVAPKDMVAEIQRLQEGGAGIFGKLIGGLLASMQPELPERPARQRGDVTVGEQGDVHFHFENAMIVGFNNFEDAVADAWERRCDRGGFSRTIKKAVINK